MITFLFNVFKRFSTFFILFLTFSFLRMFILHLCFFVSSKPPHRRPLDQFSRLISHSCRDATILAAILDFSAMDLFYNKAKWQHCIALPRKPMLRHQYQPSSWICYKVISTGGHFGGHFEFLARNRFPDIFERYMS